MTLPAVTQARRAAARIMKDLRSGHLLDASFERNTAALDHRDRRWVQELVWGVLRNRERYDHILSSRIRGGLGVLEPDVLDILRLGVHQLLAMDSVPPYAAIGQSVEAVKFPQPQHTQSQSSTRRNNSVSGSKAVPARAAHIGAAKLTNAVLRRIDRERHEIEHEIERGIEHDIEHENKKELGGAADHALALQYSHPEWLVQRWTERWGVAQTRSLLQLNNTPAPVVLRPQGVDSATLAERLADENVQVEPHALVSDSLVITGSVNITSLEAFSRGEFFVQDPAATLVAMYAHVDAGSLVADLCAAPGSKALELARRASLVIASDWSRQRVARMVQGFTRLGILTGNPSSTTEGVTERITERMTERSTERLTDRVVVLVSDATQPSILNADAVLVDVPCTGTGTFRRHPDARWRIQTSDLAVLPSVQRRILEAASTLIKLGGLLIYSTCSLETEENDEPVDAFLSRHPEFSLEPPPAGVVPETVLDNGRLRVLPQLHGTDGAFAVRLRRIA